jgi:hypothetical protein
MRYVARKEDDVSDFVAADPPPSSARMLPMHAAVTAWAENRSNRWRSAMQKEICFVDTATGAYVSFRHPRDEK